MLLKAILSLILIFLNVAPSHTFASWFMAACLTDLWDPSEVMMGHYIIPFNESPHKDAVNLQVFDPDTMEEIPIESYDNLNASDSNIVGIVGGDKKVIDLRKRSFVELEDGSTSYRFLLKFTAESSLQLKDLQYVIDSKVIANSFHEEEYHDVEPNLLDDGIIGKDNVSIDAIPRFSAYKNGCDGRRGYGIAEDSGLKFEVTIPSSSLIKFRREKAVIGVQIVGGWACGREAVKLTEPLYFILSGDNDEASSSLEDEIPPGENNNEL